MRSGDEAALGGQFAAQGADLVLAVQCPFPPGRLLLRGHGLDAVGDPGLGLGLRFGDLRAGGVVLVGEGTGHPGVRSTPTAATASAIPGPAGPGGATSTPVAIAGPVKNTRTASARAASRRNQPRQKSALSGPSFGQ